jgi:CheY-like chemotaxis protein
MVSIPIAEKRILLVDDDDSLRLAIERGLQAEGYAVTSADDGEEAVRLVREHPCSYFDAVIMDYSLRYMTGGEAVNAMRQKCPDISVLYLSGHDLPRDIIRGEAFLQKPVMLEDLIETVERLLRSKCSTLPPGAP